MSTTHRKIKIGILEPGLPPEELAPSFGNYPSMVESWLGEINAEYQSWTVLNGKFPSSPDEADLWVITGSKFGVYEDHDWIAPLEDFIRACKAEHKLMVGICFGHQIIAQALGGKVAQAGKGWGLGINHYAVTSDWPEALKPSFETMSLQAYHQDQVLEAPEGTKTIASSEFCENAALWYPDFAITVQGHPEFRKDYSTALIKNYKGVSLTDEEADEALATMTMENNAAALAEVVAKMVEARFK